jgi:hypothetical protein
MSWRGRLSYTFALVSVAICLMVAAFAGAAPSPPSGQLGPLAPFKLADGLPRALGPSIIDATYRATGPAGAGNDSLFVIFSEDVTPGSVAIADFNFNGGLAFGDVGGLAGGSIVRVDRNLVVLSGFTTPITAANADSVQLSARGVVTGTDGSISSDVSLLPIRTGPAIWRAEIDYSTISNRPNTDALRLYFTHELVAASLNLANPRVDFDMPEFGTGTTNLTAAIVGGTNNKVLDITFGNQEAASVASHGKMLANISRIRILPGQVTGDFTIGGAGLDNADELNTGSIFHLVDEALDDGTAIMGPYMVAAGYNDKATVGLADDVLTVVFSDDIDPSTVLVGDFLFPVGGVSPVLGSNDGDHILTFTDFTGAGGPVVGTPVVVIGPISDFQGNPNPAGDVRTITPSPIIVSARYQDAGDSDPATDILEIFFDSPMIGSFADTTDFNYYGFVSNGLIVTDNTDNDSLLVLTGFTAGNNWEYGDRIGLRTGTNLTAGGPAALPSGNGLTVNAVNTGADATFLVRDYSQPRQLHFALNLPYFRDGQGVGPADTAYYAFDERDVDDAAYFILFTRRNTAVNEIYIETHLNNGRFIANPYVGSTAPADLNRIIIGTYDITPGVGTYSDGQIIQLGDNVNFGICAVDADGNIALNTTSCLFVGALVAGPVPAPRDHDCVCFEPAPGQLDPQGFGVNNYPFCNPVPGTTTDTDMIHIVGNRNPEEHFIFGDVGSAIGADSVRVYDDPGLTVLLGQGPANPITGQFSIFSIGQPTGDYVYVVSVDFVGGTSTLSLPTPIRNDLLNYDVLYASTFRDPINSLERYSPGDTVRILGAAVDTAGDQEGLVFRPAGAFKSDLLALSADFRGFSTRAGSDSVVFISLGANRNDEDNDWIDVGPVRFDNTVISGNNVKDYPEPYVDENGNGVYDCGETFVDYTGAGYTTNIWDDGDANLDSGDDQEHGWYYVEYWIDPNDATLVADPDGGDNFATLEDVNIPIRILDNGILNQASLDLLSSELPGQANRVTMSFQTDLSLDHLTNTAADSVFTATLDALAPTVSEISYLAKMTSLTQGSIYPAGNVITPGDNVYELPSGLATPYVNFVDSTVSDDDVIFVATQIDTTANTQDNNGWRYLSFDPPGDRAQAGFPGIRNIDDDYDTTGYFGVNVKTNGIDDDEDGEIDEDGEGVDFSDPEVVDAMQADAAADAAAANPDGIHRQNDGIDNDNDAFFRHNPITGQVVWFNIDESITNGVDDDGDGMVDEADEVENYIAVNDDDEDGMHDGTVAYIGIGMNTGTIAQLTGGTFGSGGTIGVKAFEDPAQMIRYNGSRNSRPVMAGVGITPGSWLMSYLDKSSDIIGNVSTAFAQRGGKDDFAFLARGARNIISPNFDGTARLPYLYTGGNSFWFNYRGFSDRNLDLNRVQALYNLVDGSEYRIRAVAVDQAYNHNPNWAVPVRFTLDSTAPVVCILPAHNSDTPGTGAAPEFDDFVDVKPAVPGLQVFDKGAHPGPYTLQAQVVSGDDIASVYFQIWNPGTLSWEYLPPNPSNPDNSFPYTLYWDAPLLNNAPPANADTFYFRAYAVDEHGNTEAQFLDNDPPTVANGPVGELCADDGRNWELQVIVIDGTAPQACLCQVGSDYDLSDGAAVPSEQAVDVSAWFTDNDGDPNTNDVIHVYFEYTPIGQNSWSPFASLTGVPADGFLRDPSGIQHPVIYTGPDTLKTTVTWDTRGLAEGSYEIRAVAVDIEGNTSILTSCVFTVTIDKTPLRAYIQPVVDGVNTLDTCAIATVDTLFAQVFIHDRTVSQVEFQYYADTNGDGQANDGGSWITIDTLGDDVSERKGDVTLRAGFSSIARVREANHLPFSAFAGSLKFWDADNNGYSSIDPIVFDNNLDGFFNGSDSVRPFGPGTATPPANAPLSNFDPNEYLADASAFGNYDAGDWVMQDNPLNGGPEQVDLWWVLWDVTGLGGDYLVRAVATDNLGNTDSDLVGSPIPVAQKTIDSTIPSAEITLVTLQDKSTIPPGVDGDLLIDGDYVSGANSFFYLTATSEDDDIKNVLFQYSINGGVTWNNIDVNDDNDMYSDLNQNWQFDEGIDEIFIDVDGSCTYSAGDIVLSKGDNNVIDTPFDGKYAALFPLVGEDPNGDGDEDGDGKTDEDSPDSPSNLGGQSYEDWFAPYTVPFNFHNIMFATETNVLFRAIACDLSGNIDCDPEMVSLVLGDNKAPETDIVVAVVDGDSLDIETVLRGTLNPYCLDSTTVAPMHLLVTAEDQSEIIEVDIFYRRIDGENAYAFPPVEYQAAGLTDTAYPYEFVWDITTLEDGVYEFFARALDANGNVTMAPENPYTFSINRNTATVTSAAFLGSGLPVSEVVEDDVVILTASVSDPTIDGTVCFYVAERIEGEVVTGISTTFPYVSAELVDNMVPATGNGVNEVVVIGGLPGIYVDPADWASTPGKTYLHYTVRNGDQLEFGAAVPNGTVVTVDYNITSYFQVDCDDDDPYTTEWSVWEAEDDDATHWDVIAAFGPEGFECQESLLSEGLHFRIVDVDFPQFTVHGIDDIDGDGNIDANDNMPGNALCISQGLGFDNDSPTGTTVNKLSGDWAEIFVTLNDTDIDSVWMIVRHTFDGAPEDTCAMTENPLVNDPPQPVHKVLHISDLPEIDPARVENVVIRVSGYNTAPSTRDFPMYDDGVTGDDLVAGDGHYTVLLQLDPGDTYDYKFIVDLNGDDEYVCEDPRHDESTIVIPQVPYWWCSVRLDDDSVFHQNAINHVHVYAMDNEGNIADNTAEGNQGQIDVILDREAPTVNALTTDRPVVAPGSEVQVFATVVDPTPADINVITVTEVLFQVSPDASRNIWIDWESDSDPSNGWGGVYGWGFNPLDDDIDNDLDGIFDEADESAFVYWIRAVAIDDCHNHGYSSLQNPQVVTPITVDATPPSCTITEPTNGAIFAYGSTITISATGTDTDVLYVSFQYNVGDGWRAIDATPIDDTDIIDGFDGDETPAYPVDGTATVTWNTSFLDETDQYIRIRCVARDIAGNWSGHLENPFGDTAPGDPLVEYITIILNDNTAPFAQLTEVVGNGLAYLVKSIVDPTLAISRQVQLLGIAAGGRNGDVATVLLQYSTDGENWTDAGTTNALVQINDRQYQFAIEFDTRALGLADGPVWLRTAAVDHDGNTQGDTNGNGILESSETVAGAVRVLVDNSEPAMWITQVGPVTGSPVPDHTLIQYDLWPREVQRGLEFDDDENVDNDLTFAAADPNDGSVDVLNFVFLQFYDDWTEQENPVWRPSFPTIPNMDADDNGIIDVSELQNWMYNRYDYAGDIEDFQDDNDDWRFSYRDGAGNNGPAGPAQDGRWFLTFGSLEGLKSDMNDAAFGDMYEENGDAPRELNPQGFPLGGLLPDREYQFRALSVDYAGNANTGYNGHTLRIDATNPTVDEIFAGNAEIEAGGGGGDQSTPNTVQVAGGDDVPLAALIIDDYVAEDILRGAGLRPNGFDPDLPGTDSESSGIHGVMFEYMAQSGYNYTWHNIGLGTYDAETGLWTINWTTPANLSRTGPQAGDGSSTTDSLYAIRATAVDSAGNLGDLVRYDAVLVQDITPPDDTEIVDINGRTYPRDTNEETVRDAGGTWVAGEVELVAATQYGDPSVYENNSDNDDVFDPLVTFEARMVGSNTWRVIETTDDPYGDDYAPGVTALQSHEGPRWYVDWNTLATNGNGDRVWPDGQYHVRAFARDVWGNVEILEGAEAPMQVLVTVDNTPPSAEVDANWQTAGRELEATVERNNPSGYTVLVRTANNTEDVKVHYYYKLSTDLNVEGSWQHIEPGFDDSDQNPDRNRPFSFDWDVNSIADCDDTLIPGLSYDIGFEISDLLDNTMGVVAAHDAGLTARLHVTDTIAPKATITELVRNVGNSETIEFPENVRVRSIDYLQATVLNGHRDVESVQFWYIAKTGATAPAFNTGTWTLADGDIKYVGDQTWRLKEWDSSSLPEGEYWFAAVAEDCFANRDATPATIVLVIDRTGPTFAGVNPSNDEKLVPEVTDCTSNSSPRIIDLIVRNLDNDVDYTTFSNNAISFQYKKSETADREENWVTITSQELKDNGVSGPIQPTYSAAINLRNLQGDGLYDFRVCASDKAGNTTYFTFATKTVVDNTDPVLEISHILFLNRQDDDVLDLTPQPVNGGILPDISAGEQIRLYTTASDDESQIPPSHETGVFEIQYYLTSGPSGSGTYPQAMGTAGFDAERQQYYIVWNTTGLLDGDYTIEARGQDEVRNCTVSQQVTGKVTNPAKPLAQVVAFNPDLLSEITKGTNSRVYGLTFGEKLANTMFFQYRPIPAQGAPGDWINIGAATNTGEVLTSRQLSLLPMSLWFANMRISDIADGTNIDFRAVAVASSNVGQLGLGSDVAVDPATEGEAEYYGRTVNTGFAPADGDPGDFSGLYDVANTPILRMVKRTGAAGFAYLEYVPTSAPDHITQVGSAGVNFSNNSLITVTTTAGPVSPFVVAVGEDGTGRVEEYILEMNRRIDNPLVWTGEFWENYNSLYNLDPTEGARITVFATAHAKRTTPDATPARIDMAHNTWHIHQVTHGRGSNGIAGIDGDGRLAADGCPTDDFAFEVEPGGFDYNVGMLLDRVNRPTTPTEQDLYLSAFGPTYRVSFLDDDWDYEANWAGDEGWMSHGWIRYDDSDPAIGDENEVTVRRWNGNAWTADGISHIEVDTETNCIHFTFDPNAIDEGTHSQDYFYSGNAVFSAVTTDRFSPVQVAAYPYYRGYTDQDPIFKAILTNSSEAIDPNTIRVFVDGREVAARRSNGGTWYLYNGTWLDVEQIDGDGRRYEVTLGWPCENVTELKGGQHTFEVWFSDYARSTFFGVDQPWVFEVDRTPPTIILNGAFVGDPQQNTAPGYIGEETDAITVKLIDTEAGVLFREDRIDDDDYSHYWWYDVEDYCKIARYVLLYDQWFYENEIPIQFDTDNGFKYDLWVVDAESEDDQNSIDEIEERTLLHTGTADELWPNVTFSEDGDTLTVPLYILGGGRIKDGDVLEVVLYSKRYEVAPFTNHLNEVLDQIAGQGGLYGDGWWFDFSSKRFVQYAASVQDMICNTGSRFVEQRFIVDKGAPEVTVTSPGVSCDGSPVEVPFEPTTDYNFNATFTDLGAGVDVASVTVTVGGPVKDGDEDGQVTLTNVEITEDGVSFTIPKAELNVGHYSIRIRGEDRIGNKFDKTCTLVVGGTTNALGNVYAYPNPFNPGVTDVTLTFENVRNSTVTVSVYDWNGDKVATIIPGQLAAGQNQIKWGGQSDDGKPLANGVYLARIEANDGRRTVTQVLKLAIWRD